MSPNQSTVEWVTETVIRQHFNDGQILEKVRNGELVTSVKWESHRIPPPGGEPVCTRSQMIKYSTPGGDLVALAHQYLRPDGTIGARGRPDPKKMFLENKVIAFRTLKKTS